jgi:hypothetical protein
MCKGVIIESHNETLLHNFINECFRKILIGSGNTIFVATIFGGMYNSNKTGGSLKKATTAALNMDIVKCGYKTYKKIRG